MSDDAPATTTGDEPTPPRRRDADAASPQPGDAQPGDAQPGDAQLGNAPAAVAPAGPDTDVAATRPADPVTTVPVDADVAVAVATAAPRPTWRRLLGEGVLVTLAGHVFSFLFFAAARASGHTFFQDVLINGLAPDRTANAAWLKAGVLPTWTRTTYGGGPYLANLQHAFYYPGNLPFLFMHPSMGIKAIVVTTIAFSALAMWAFCRIALRTRFWPAVVAGVAYAFSGMLLQHVILTNQLQVMAWTPVVLLFGHLALERGKLRYVVATSIAIGIQLLAGHPEEWVYTLGMLASYGVVWSFGAGLREWPRRALHGAIRLGGAVVLFVLLFGFQLFPTLVLRGQGFRTAPNFREQYPLPKATAINALLPDFGRVLVGENVGFIGVAALLLAVFGIASSRRADLLWWRIWALAISLGGWVMALGNSTPLYRFLYENVSVVRGFRVPSRYLLLPTFALAAAAALGLDALLYDGIGRLRDRVRQALAFLAVAIPSVAVLFWLGDISGSGPSFKKWVLAAAITGACWLVAYVRAIPRVAIALVLLVTTAVELYYARPQAEFRQVAPNAIYDLGSPLTRRMGDEGGRFVTIADLPRDADERRSIPVPAGFSQHDTNYFLAGYQFHVIARPNVELGEHAETILGRDGGLLPFRTYNEFFDATIKAPGQLYRGIYLAPPSKWNWDTLDFLAVRWFVTEALPLTEEQVLRSHGFQPVDSYAYVTLWQRQEPPLVRVVGDVDVVADEQERLARLRAGYPLQERAIVERAVDVTPGATGSVSDVHVGNTVVSATVTATDDAVVVLSDPWYPQWQAYVDGKKSDLLRVNHAFRGVRVPAGSHKVEFRYEDAAHQRGVTLALVTIATLLLWSYAVTPLRRRRAVDRRDEA